MRFGANSWLLNWNRLTLYSVGTRRIIVRYKGKGKRGFVLRLVVTTPLRRSGMARVLKGSHSFTCTPCAHPLTEWTIPALVAYTVAWEIRLSPRLSVKRVNCDKARETSAHILVFQQQEWLVGTTPSTWNFGPNWPLSCKNADFQSILSSS